MLVTDDVIRGIEEVTPLAPLHNPGSVTGIKACRKEMPNIPHVVVFDTAFHQDHAAQGVPLCCAL